MRAPGARDAADGVAPAARACPRRPGTPGGCSRSSRGASRPWPSASAASTRWPSSSCCRSWPRRATCRGSRSCSRKLRVDGRDPVREVLLRNLKSRVGLGREEGQLRLPHRVRRRAARRRTATPGSYFANEVASHFANLLKVSRVEGTRFHAGRCLLRPAAAADGAAAQRPHGRAAALARARRRGGHALHPAVPRLGAREPPRPGVPRGARRHRGQRAARQRAAAASAAPDRRVAAAVARGRAASRARCCAVWPGCCSARSPSRASSTAVEGFAQIAMVLERLGAAARRRAAAGVPLAGHQEVLLARHPPARGPGALLPRRPRRSTTSTGRSRRVHPTLHFPEHPTVAFIPGTFDPFTSAHQAVVVKALESAVEALVQMDDYSWRKHALPRQLREELAWMALAADARRVPGAVPAAGQPGAARPACASCATRSAGASCLLVVGSDVLAGASAYADGASEIWDIPHVVVMRDDAQPEGLLDRIDGFRGGVAVVPVPQQVGRSLVHVAARRARPARATSKRSATRWWRARCSSAGCTSTTRRTSSRCRRPTTGSRCSDGGCRRTRRAAPSGRGPAHGRLARGRVRGRDAFARSSTASDEPQADRVGHVAQGVGGRAARSSWETRSSRSPGRPAARPGCARREGGALRRGRGRRGASAAALGGARALARRRVALRPGAARRRRGRACGRPAAARRGHPGRRRVGRRRMSSRCCASTNPLVLVWDVESVLQPPYAAAPAVRRALAGGRMAIAEFFAAIDPGQRAAPPARGAAQAAGRASGRWSPWRDQPAGRRWVTLGLGRQFSRDIVGNSPTLAVDLERFLTWQGYEGGHLPARRQPVARAAARGRAGAGPQRPAARAVPRQRRGGGAGDRGGAAPSASRCARCSSA